MIRIAAIALLPLAVSGCIARAAYNVVTAPVKAVGWTADKLTTSQAEEDEKRGRDLRREDERRGREAREAARRARETDPD